MRHPRSFKCSAEGVVLYGFASEFSSVDISFDGHRVWSIDLRNLRDGKEIAWPAPVTEKLRGKSLVSISDSATNEKLDEQEIVFSADPGRPDFTDQNGVRMSVNKWGRLAPDLSAIGEGIHELILDRTQTLIKQLQDAGLRPFVVGGTLLGGVREKALLPHDDDADIAYLSEHQNPFLVAREAYRVGRLLEKLGYEIVRHSATHMQLHFRDDLQHAEYYIDVFTAFFTADGHINQPFHVRGEMKPDQMLPFGEVEIAGRKFPAPRDVDAWLTINYDENWRTPIPGFALATPEKTTRRFDNWFGIFDSDRHFWNEHFSEKDSDQIDLGDTQSWILENQHLLKSKTLIDLGSGDGNLATQLASKNRFVVATDYAREALAKISARASKNNHLKAFHANLYRLNSIAIPKLTGVQGSFDVSAIHVFDAVHKKGYKNILRLIRMALNSGGNAVAVFYTKRLPSFKPDDPTTWHTNPLDIFPLANELNLGMRIIKRFSGDGQAVAIIFSNAKEPFEFPKERNLKKLIKRILKELDPRGTRRQIRELKQEIAELKQELDEYRSHTIEFAQLMDMAEQALGAETSKTDQKAQADD